MTRTNKGLQITGATAVMADAYYRGYIDAAIDAANEAANTLQLGNNTNIPGMYCIVRKTKHAFLKSTGNN